MGAYVDDVLAISLESVIVPSLNAALMRSCHTADSGRLPKGVRSTFDTLCIDDRQRLGFTPEVS